MHWFWEVRLRCGYRACPLWCVRSWVLSPVLGEGVCWSAFSILLSWLAVCHLEWQGYQKGRYPKRARFSIICHLLFTPTKLFNEIKFISRTQSKASRSSTYTQQNRARSGHSILLNPHTQKDLHLRCVWIKKKLRQNLTMLPRLVLFSGDLPARASRVTGTIGMHHWTWLDLKTLNGCCL